MKVRDLLRKIVNGEDLPQKIKINNDIYVLNNLKCLDEIYAVENKRWEYYNFSLIDFYDNEVEVINEETKTTTRESIEALGYACGEIQKCFTNGWGKSLKNKSLNEEDEKIRKIKVEYSPDIEEKIFYENVNKPRHYVLGDAGTELLINKINEIIDKINGATNGE